MKTNITPQNITKLKKNEVFVFGSNLLGNHAGGAALLAVKSFGAINGQGIGLQGKSYALPTLTESMDKISLDKMSGYITELQVCAINNPKLHFLVTEVGCGIAGFKREEIAPLFKKFIGIDNFSLPQSFIDLLTAPIVVPGFKGYHKGLVCTPSGVPYQYSENTVFTHPKSPELCSHGFHFCRMPLDVMGYYPPKIGAEYTEVEAQGETMEDGNKTATNKLAVKGKISIGNLFKAHFDIVYSKVKKEIEASDSTTTTAGNYAHANTAGNYAHANTAGYKAHANTAGNYAHANTAGYKAHASVKGKNSIAVALGVGSLAKGALGCWIVVTEWEQQPDWSYNVKEVKSTLVDGEVIKADTYYSLKDGYFIESI